MFISQAILSQSFFLHFYLFYLFFFFLGLVAYLVFQSTRHFSEHIEPPFRTLTGTFLAIKMASCVNRIFTIFKLITLLKLSPKQYHKSHDPCSIFISIDLLFFSNFHFLLLLPEYYAVSVSKRCAMSMFFFHTMCVLCFFLSACLEPAHLIVMRECAF